MFYMLDIFYISDDTLHNMGKTRSRYILPSFTTPCLHTKRFEEETERIMLLKKKKKKSTVKSLIIISSPLVEW